MIEICKALDGKMCSCGKVHEFPVKKILCSSGASEKLGEQARALGATCAFVICDKTTWGVLAEKAVRILNESGIPSVVARLSCEVSEPDESSLGSLMMRYDPSCDVIVGVGSGVINDLGKMVSLVTGKPYIILGTAPSMDGYASATSSMIRDGLKVSLNSKMPDVIIGDTDILKNAPMRMMLAGFGDMLAKYISICEWRVANIVTGEYYCEEIAKLIRHALKTCVDNAEGLAGRDESAVEAVFYGLVISGIAATYAGVSRPVSGVEHYISHVFDMRAVSLGQPQDLHGIQCAVGTVAAMRGYDALKTVIPDMQRAKEYASKFDYAQYSKELSALLGDSADTMIALEAKEGKYALEGHALRLERIILNWDKILRIIDEELPRVSDIVDMLRKLNAPVEVWEIGQSREIMPMVFKATKDIRDKYVLSRLLHDLGVIESVCEKIF